MKAKILLLACALAITTAHAGVLRQFKLQQCTIELLDKEGAAAVTGKPDAYTHALTSFDLQIRLGRQRNVSEKDYLALAVAQAQSWSEEDQGKLLHSIEEIGAFLEEQHIQLQLPPTIQFLKTGGAEEFGAEGYTRENRISLHVAPGQEITTAVVAHELFHVYSRFNPAVRDQVYALFGFEKCNPINTFAAMNNRVITNPDCPVIKHFIPLEVDGKTRDFVLQLYSTKPFSAPFDLSNAGVGLLEVSGTAKDMKPVLVNGKGVLLTLESTPQLFDKIGQNTPYVLHPEEISAEHFSMWITGKPVPQQGYIEQLQRVLTAASPK